MYQKSSENCNSSNDPIRSRSNDENTEILIDSDNEDELTSSGISEDEDEDEENMSTENNCQEGKHNFFPHKNENIF
jgi:hypothetical protein